MHQLLKDPDSSSSASGPHSYVWIFLMLPIVGLIIGFIIGASRKEIPTASPIVTPPAVTYVPYSLINKTAPPFTLNTPANQSISLQALQGQWVFLNFWATWCKPCVSEMADLLKLQQGEYGQPTAGLTVLAVNHGETQTEINTFLAQHHLAGLPVVMDADNAISGKYVVLALPITYILDPQGIIRWQQVGPLTPETIKNYLRQIQAMDN